MLQLVFLYLRQKFFEFQGLMVRGFKALSFGRTEALPEKKVEMLVEVACETPAWYNIAMKELGTEEYPGEANNPKIEDYHRATTIKDTDDSVPWCSSFVCWCLQQAGKKSTQSAWARSFLKYGVYVKHPQKGDIVVFTRGKGGHVGFYHGQTERDILVLGGNQGNKVSILNFPKTRLLAIRRPV